MSLDPEPALTSAGGAIEGALSSTALAQVSARWTQELSSWCTAARSYEEGLNLAADRYQNTDRSAADSHRGHLPVGM